ncbi:carboxypeptidase-like regulatory domain-containing protein [Tamlana sp. 2201CG12-4]|uniref:carboxypeptidase-like regulatory domain-containing protein n=1 Tax=Tamlana sp. 2201CG12-4 TaxID=3112582 RepID=UPI002DBA4711|nr:carboxypeptidase-like regulatory domain-containing protein [Tamlana sp. 2201CG12-4]MEC3907411.1 carboxypeptidase-like regulatory domain-containing protein [Tamlana sp. 2201CG12-4]
MKNIFLIIVFGWTYFSANSQSITAQLIDKTNKTPVQYATIKTGMNSGVISNEEGFFTIYTDENKLNTITISCLGYQNKTLTISDIKARNFVIMLEEAINELGEVFISNKAPNADSIIAKVNKKLHDNYDFDLTNYSVFRRTTDYIDFNSLDFEIEKASHFKKKNLEAANSNLMALSRKIRESDIKEFADFKGDLYLFNKDSSKLVVDKATKLLDYKNDFSMDEIQEKAQHIVLKYLDTTKTYKLKTGIFKIEDSLALKDEDFKDEEKKEYRTTSLNNQTRSFLRRAQFYDNSFLNKILNNNRYNYTFEKITYHNDNLTYIVNFTPRKGKSKYSGKIFVNDDDYAITRLDYNYYKNRHGDKINLKLILGVKYIENVSSGTVLFEKSNDTKYHPKYLKRTNGSYFYVNRNVKFIENSKTKNKVNFSFKIEGDSRNKEELLFTSNKKITLNEFRSIKQDSIVPIKQLSKFEKTIWENEDTLEPLQEMKEFSSEN